MIDTNLTFRTIDVIDTLVDGLEKRDDSRVCFGDIDAIDMLLELLAPRSSSEAARLRRRLARVRSEYIAILAI